MGTYTLRSVSYTFVRDSPEHIDFHIRSGDYFSHLASLLGFVEEAFDRCGAGELTAKEKEMVRELRHDLRFVHANYTIIARERDDVRDIHPSGNLFAK